MSKDAIAKAMQEYNVDAYNKWDQEALEQCKGCGRTFRYEALLIHQRSCKPGRPLKERTAVMVGGGGGGGSAAAPDPEDRPLPAMAKKSHAFKQGNAFLTHDNADLEEVQPQAQSKPRRAPPNATIQIN